MIGLPSSANLTYSTSFEVKNPLTLESRAESSRSQNVSFLGDRRVKQQDEVDIGSILGDFMSSGERRHKHSLNLNYDTPKDLRKECKYLSPVDNKYHKCTKFNYDTGIWISTIVDEWDLVCDRSWFISVTQSLYMAGFIVAYLVFGYMSDRFGRWRSLLLGSSIEILSGFGCAFSGSVTSFMIFRFLLGLGNAGRSSSSYLIMIEWTGPSWRMHISTLGSLGWIIGYCSMPWIVKFFLHFRHMQLFVCFYELLFVIWILRLPETPRWLLTHRKFNEAYDVLMMAAKFNGLIIKEQERDSSGCFDDLSSSSPYVTALSHFSSGNSGADNTSQAKFNGHLERARIGRHNQLSMVDIEKDCAAAQQNNGRGQLLPYTREEFDTKFKQLSNTILDKEFTKNEDKLSIFDLFKWTNLRKYALILAFAWACNSFIYYGIALRVGDFGVKNLFIAFTNAGIIELPSIAFTMLCMKYLPRKTTNTFLFAIILLLCILQIPLKYYDYQWLQQATMLMAKLFNSCSFTCILYQTMELFPTSIRQTAYSSCALAGRIGSIMAPFIKELSQMTSPIVPPLIYAALSVMEIILIRFLPETRGSDLPDTLLEAERFKGTL